MSPKSMTHFCIFFVLFFVLAKESMFGSKSIYDLENVYLNEIQNFKRFKLLVLISIFTMTLK
jgi:hypothetical protein